MSSWQKALLLALRILLGLGILTTFAVLLGVGVARQAALGGGFSEATQSALTEHPLRVWAQTGGPVLLATLALAALERWLSGRWDTKT